MTLTVTSTTSQETTNTPLTVNNDGTRISWGGEWVGLVIILYNCPFHGHPLRTVLEIFTCEGLNASSATNCHPVEVVFDYGDTSFIVHVKHLCYELDPKGIQ